MKKYLVMLLVLAMGANLAACRKPVENPKTSSESMSEKPTQSQSESPSESSMETEAPTESETETQAQANPLELGFDDLEGYEFLFSSGAGGWGTFLYIHEDGSFEGSYEDSDMGDVDDAYPNGTRYQSVFLGKLSALERVNDYTYKTRIEELHLENEVSEGTEGVIIDGTRVFYSEPYGLEGADSLLIYTPDAPISELPTDYYEWACRMTDLTDGDQLGVLGIYNETALEGFVGSYNAYFKEGEHVNLAMQAYRNTQIASDNIKYILENNLLDQQQLSDISSRLYKNWDKTLNELWNILKDNMTEEEYKTLLSSENDWIASKLAAMEEAGKKLEGGSLAAMEENMVGATMTEERCGYLIEEIKKLDQTNKE